MTNPEKESIQILEECAELQRKKDRDYNRGSVEQADYYTYGVWSILDTIHAKYLRLRSVLEQIEAAENEGKDHVVSNESVEDSFKDLINYASFGAAWMRYGVPGQDARSGLFSNRVPKGVDEFGLKENEILGANDGKSSAQTPPDEFQKYMDATFERVNKVAWRTGSDDDGSGLDANLIADGNQSGTYLNQAIHKKIDALDNKFDTLSYAIAKLFERKRKPATPKETTGKKTNARNR